MTHFAGLILAGGEGRRWGGPKAWAELPDGSSFLERCVEILGDAGAAPIVATLPPSTVDPQLEGLVTAPLPEPGLDMFASLVTGLSRLADYPNWEVVSILPVDHPLVSAQTVIALSNTTARATIPEFNGKHGHPVCLRRSVIEQILDGRLSGPTLREVMRSVDAVDMPVEDAGVVSNCNTPEALAGALKNLGVHFP